MTGLNVGLTGIGLPEENLSEQSIMVFYAQKRGLPGAITGGFGGKRGL